MLTHWHGGEGSRSCSDGLYWPLPLTQPEPGNPEETQQRSQVMTEPLEPISRRPPQSQSKSMDTDIDSDFGDLRP